VLIKEREILRIEGIEKLVPLDLFQGGFRLAEVDAEQPRAALFIAMSCPHHGRVAVTRFNPLADLIVIGGSLSSCHDWSPWVPRERARQCPFGWITTFTHSCCLSRNIANASGTSSMPTRCVMM